MSRFLCCCFQSSTPQPPREENQLQERRSSRSGSHLSQSLPAPASSDSTSEDRRGFERSQQSSRHNNEKYTIVSDKATILSHLELECLIVPSFGKDPPINVAVKKESSSDFLQGVGDDLKIIQRLIGRDIHKKLGEVQLMCHFEQVKRAQFANTIKERMQDLKLNYRYDQKGCKWAIQSCITLCTIIMFVWYKFCSAHLVHWSWRKGNR